MANTNILCYLDLVSDQRAYPELAKNTQPGNSQQQLTPVHGIALDICSSNQTSAKQLHHKHRCVDKTLKSAGLYCV